MLHDYGWPGNVRQLCNEVQRIVARSENGTLITPEQLSPELRQMGVPTVPTSSLNVLGSQATGRSEVIPIENISLAEALEEVRPSFNAFVVTFLLTGMYWVGHRDLFALIRRTDRGLVWLNILYLLPVCLLPFGASLLGPYGREPTALHIYGLVLLAISVMRVVIWWYATSRPHLLWQRLDDRQRRAGLALAVFPGLIYLLAILVAAAAPTLSLLIYAGAPVLYFLSITVLRSGRKQDQEYADFT